ncbi:phosphoribosylglycinamide synthetase [Xylariales sp. AK1849]|nr:phosphoribosylglycinamide synthetase [Xylariales sp. AK1849]
MSIEYPLRVLLIGNGGREHAIAWKLSQSPNVESIVAVPGNGGTATTPKTTNVTSVPADDFPGLLELARKENINYVVPGPEAPLVAGAVDFFNNVGLQCFGPSKAAARMEGSKTFSKDFMKKWNIPTAAYENFFDYDKAREYIGRIDHDVVLKADGLAAGKGVIIPTTKEQAHQALKDIMLNKEFGSAGDEVVIEEFLTGDELSVLTFCDGFNIRSLPPAQDHKRVGDGDTGLNTGGMGCYAPTNIATPKLVAQLDEIIQKTVDGLRKDKMPFKGILFTGFMITLDGPKVLEYNVRFGDPETQTVLPLLSRDTDLAEIMVACSLGHLDATDVTIRVEDKFGATVVVAAGGYPEAYTKGDEMAVQEPPTGINIFHAGTKIHNGKLQTNGGRVIASTATGDSLRAAVDKAYDGVKLIQFNKMYYRKDIAHRAFRPTEDTKKAMTYAEAGVNIEGGNQFVERIKEAVRSTRIPGANAELGGFGGEVNLFEAGYTGSTDNLVLVSAIDGVGTKLMIAQQTNKHDTVGIDLVAMNVNDLVVQGARPLKFLDYIGCSRLDSETSASFVEGVCSGCIQAGCALVGGETAEMPGMYQGEDYDAAGCAIGIMDSSDRLPRLDAMAEGDVLLGLASSGVHSNGFSLVRRILEQDNLTYDTQAPWDNSRTVGESLLTPTKIYVKPLLKAVSKLKGLAHITGGGLTENVPRMLPEKLAAQIDVTSWQQPAVFKYLKKAGNVAPAEMARAFNNGVGMVAVVSPSDAEGVVRLLQDEGETVYTIGKLISRTREGCVLEGLESWE